MNIITHRDNTLPDDRGAVFVFGSNLAGKHLGGAAKVAVEKFGALDGWPRGACGFSYAIPTLDENFGQLPVEQIALDIAALINHARNEPQTEFFVTRVGCGIAGFADADIAPLFKRAPINCNFPDEWKPYVE